MATLLTFGKHKHEMLENTPESYIRWLATHKMVLSVENRHFSDLAKAILDRRAQTVVASSGNANWQEWHESLVAKPVSNDLGNKATDISTRGTLYKAFSLMR
jgi:hypothetical protein